MPCPSPSVVSWHNGVASRRCSCQSFPRCQFPWVRKMHGREPTVERLWGVICILYISIFITIRMCIYIYMCIYHGSQVSWVISTPLLLFCQYVLLRRHPTWVEFSQQMKTFIGKMTLAYSGIFEQEPPIPSKSKMPVAWFIVFQCIFDDIFPC